MRKRIGDAFGGIEAGHALQEKTAAYLHQEIARRSNQKKAHYGLRAAVLAVCACLVFAAGGLYSHFYRAPVAYIDMDVNPSMELTVNRVGRVLGAAAYNEEAQEILQAADIRNRPYQEAVDILLKEMIEQAYLAPDGLVSVTVQAAGADVQEALLGGVEAVVEATLTAHHATAAVEVYGVSEAVKAGAVSHHVTPAKYIAITELQSVDETASFDTCAGHSIVELRRQTRAHGEGHQGMEGGEGMQMRNHGHH